MFEDWPNAGRSDQTARLTDGDIEARIEADARDKFF